MCRRDDDPVTIATTSGRAIPDTEVRIVDRANVAVPAGEPGEDLAGHFFEGRRRPGQTQADLLATGENIERVSLPARIRDVGEHSCRRFRAIGCQSQREPRGR